MKTLLNKRFLMCALFLPLTLFAEISSSTDLNEMLIKPSVIDIPQDTLDQQQHETDVEQLKESSNQLGFLSNLQANFGSMNMPAAPQSVDGSPANTWVPKFVWIGDVKQSDDLKCFAAFLIGSLADKDATTAQASPGVFMTPTTTPTTAPVATQSTQNVAANLPLQQMSARSTTRPAPPPPMPDNSCMYSEGQVGLGFLYFAGVKGNLIAEPNRIYKDVTGTNRASGIAFPQTVRGKIQYNRTPVYTVDFGWKLGKWVDFGCTMQAQQGIFIRTKPFQFSYLRNNANPEETTNLITKNFESSLDFYSIGGKLMFQWAKMAKWGNWSMNLFFGGSAGGAWQSWTNVKAIQTYFNNVGDVADNITSSNISFRNQYYANLSYTGDAGFIFKPTSPTAKMAIRFGCKFISWGSARGLGDQKDQNDIFRSDNAAVVNDPASTNFSTARVKSSYFKPFRVKTIYSWAPYIGFRFDF